MLTSAVSSVSSSATSAAASTSVLATGIVTASGIVAVLLFATLLSREMALSTDDVTPANLTPLNAVVLALALAFSLNFAVETVSALA